MKITRLVVPLVAALVLCSGIGSMAYAGTAQEVFICHLKEGKTMANLKTVIEDFKKMAGKLKGGDQYQAWLLTPVAASDMADIVWVGEMPDSVSLATLQDDYATSEAGRAQDKKFQDVIACKSRSLWSSEKLK